MKKIIMWIIIIVFLGGGIYYLMGYDAKNPKKNDYLESTSDFLNDGIEKIDEGIEKGKEIIEEKKKQDSLNIK
jgi:hypothetical protein